MEPNQKEKAILKTLLEEGTYMHTTAIAKRAKISWNTAFEYLKEFESNNWIYHRSKGNRHFWKAVVEK